jgi:hypothetical protein
MEMKSSGEAGLYCDAGLPVCASTFIFFTASIGDNSQNDCERQREIYLCANFFHEVAPEPDCFPNENIMRRTDLYTDNGSDAIAVKFGL